MADVDGKRELAVRTSAATLTGLATLLGPDTTMAATAMQPLVETAIGYVATRIRQIWNRNTAEVLADAAEASGTSPENLLVAAVADDRRHELLARVLGLAQDTALRDKRRALGRALAAGIHGDNARINNELLFVRAVADIDEPHIQLLAVLASKHAQSGELSGTIFQAGWSMDAITAALPGLGEALPALLTTLEAHALVRHETLMAQWQSPHPAYNITSRGRQLLERLAQDDPEAD